jgi:hypothetical protein
MRSANSDAFGRTSIEVLQFELDFVQQGGYGRSVREPRQERVPFRDSPTCLNFLDKGRPHECGGCALMDFVPLEHRNEDVPCHHIPLDSKGLTIIDLADGNGETKAVHALEGWLQATLARLKAESGDV